MTPRQRALNLMYGRAHGAVAKAKRLGLIKPATDYKCVDCGKDAECYDHRDYTRLLCVDPVCRSCNKRRGPADVWPEWFTFEVKKAAA